MKRKVEHYEYLVGPFDAFAELLRADGAGYVDEATAEATNFAADLVDYLEHGLGFFDQDERVQAVTGELIGTAHGISLGIQWTADPSKRVLPNVEAELILSPIISSGPSATTELRLTGTYEPPPQRYRGVIEHVLVRRVADATLHTFLRHLARGLENATGTR